MRLVKHLQYMKLLKLKMLILAEFFSKSLVVDFVAPAADVGAAFVVVAVVAAVAACVETFVAVVFGPSSLFPKK